MLPDDEYGAIALLWAVIFILTSVIYRPVEQLLSRTIAERIALGAQGGHSLRVPLTLQAGFATAFAVVALVARGPIEKAFDGSATLYWTFVAAGVAYAASYFARGYLAGHRWFGLYGGLVLFEAVGRFCFPVAVAVGLASGEAAVALGIAAAPILSLLVVPAALARHVAPDRSAGPGPAPLTLRAGAGFAVAVAAIQLAEQTLINAAVLTTRATAGTVLAGVVFNALLISRAPLQLFQAVQTSLLPHLSGLSATDGAEAFARAIRVTLRAVAAFAAAVAVGMLLLGPWAMDVVFSDNYSYGRVGLAVIADRHGLPPGRRHAQPGRPGPRPRPATRPPRGWAPRRCSSPGWSFRPSRTSSCAPRPATPGRPRCSAARSGRCTGAVDGPHRDRRLDARLGIDEHGALAGRVGLLAVLDDVHADGLVVLAGAQRHDERDARAGSGTSSRTRRPASRAPPAPARRAGRGRRRAGRRRRRSRSAARRTR